MKNIQYITFLLFFGFVFACSTHKSISEHKLQNGDLIFVEARQENLSGAINRVTQQAKPENFDHVGLIEVSENRIFVLHASTKRGSNRELLEAFYKKNDENNQAMIVYRLKPEYKYTIDSAIEKANKMLGKSYNWTYILNEESYYCSDFIERAFRENTVFEHIPMNFKNPETGKIDDFWVDFYKKLEVKVPQDAPGTNPNQLAGSDKLVKIGMLKK